MMKAITKIDVSSNCTEDSIAKYKRFSLKGLKTVAVISALIPMFSANAVPIFFAGTGHYYEVIAADAISWNDANSAANSMVFSGINGHLATLTSMAENDFVNALRNIATSNSTAFEDTEFWIGAFQPAGSSEPAGGWSWVNGEGLLSAGYTNWYPGEPNAINSGEDFAALGLLGENGWNDEGLLDGIGGYIVEYSVPAPSSIALLGLGLAGFGFARRKKS